MKKLVTVFALCAAMSAVAQVESQNIVGYSTITIQRDYTLLALSFDKVGSGDMTINEAFPYQPGAMKSGGLNTSDQILTRNPSTGAYTTYRLRDTSTPVSNSWCSSATTVATNQLPSGTPAWYFSRLVPSTTNQVTINVAGQVANDATRNNTIKSGYNLFANPYPVDISLNGAGGIGYQAGMTSGGLNTSDQILVRNPSTGAYTTYRLRDTATPANSWCASGTTPTSDKLLVNSSAWYLARGVSDFQMVIQKPAGM